MVRTVVVAMDWAKQAHARGNLPSTMLLGHRGHARANYTLAYEDSDVSYKHIQQAYPHAQVLAMSEDLCRAWFDSRMQANRIHPSVSSGRTPHAGQLLVMLPTTYTFSCWIP